MTIFTLSTGWHVKHGTAEAAPEDRWLPVAKVPTSIHLDLLALPPDDPLRIEHPFADLNELDCRWVDDAVWTYRCRFPTPDVLLDEKAEEEDERQTPGGLSADLVFQGLDTIATVTLNGTPILSSDNMFVESRVSVREHLLPANQTEEDLNELLIQFDSARLVGLDRVARDATGHAFHVHQTEVGRAAVRKAQYHWGWDWGPILTTAGPWKPVLLHVYRTRIAHVRLEPALEDDPTAATRFAQGRLAVHVTVAGARARGRHSLVVSVHRLDGTLLQTRDLDLDEDAETTTHLVLDAPHLWWPRGYGPPSRYEVRVQLFARDDADAVDHVAQRFGFRHVELVREPDDDGESFFLRINGVDVFAGGSCWVPGDSFLPSMEADSCQHPERDRHRYRRWIELLAAGHQSLVRVWGGGIYEADAFYDACDELGVLVWQDFAFACASYPARDAAFRASVAREARQNVARLLHHPALVLWAGSNEDYQIVERYGLTYDPDCRDPDAWLRTDFPARILYESLLPDIVRAAYGRQTVAYHVCSPFGRGRSTTLEVDPRVGDVHQWNVWHGALHPYQALPELGGRFVSEFGMEGFPHVSTLQKYIGRGQDLKDLRDIDDGKDTNDSKDLRPGSAVLDLRNKAIGHQFRLLKYVGDNFGLGRLDDLRAWAHTTQVMQADAMTWAYRAWRRDWDARASSDSSESNTNSNKKPARRCGGVLVWQLNDCWPTISWAVVDYLLVPKPAYYAIQRALQPLAVGIVRPFHDWTTRPASPHWHRSTAHVDPVLTADTTYSVWVASSLMHIVSGYTVAVVCIEVESGQTVGPPPSSSQFPLDIRANGTTCVVQSAHFRAGPDGEGGGGGKNSSSMHRLATMKPVVITAVLLDPDQRVVSIDSSWPEPFKYLEFPDRGVHIETHLPDDALQGHVQVTAEKPVHGFVFDETEGGPRFSDNGFDIIPSWPVTVSLQRDTSNGPWPALTFRYIGSE